MKTEFADKYITLGLKIAYYRKKAGYTQEHFAELIDNGSISETLVNGEPIYEITERGLLVVNELQSNILNMIREKSLRSALRLLSFKERGSAVYCGFSQVGDDKFILECKITEKTELIMDVRLGVDSKQLLDVMMYNFDNKPEVLPS